MELCKDILVKLLSGGQVEVVFKNADWNMVEVVDSICYQALSHIKTIIEDESLNDCECYLKIEEIIRTLEILGSNGGYRHDD